ncbi:MAG: hypothetical protein Tsb002_15080 [Wenzhouxiangellaceae bacterium]
MQPSYPLRILLTVVIVLLVTAVVVAVLLATDTMLSIWQRLEALAPWASAVYLLLLAIIAMLTAWFSWRLLSGRKQREPQAPLDREALEQRIARLEAQGGSGAGARQELRELDRRQTEETLYLALFGEMSSGKSTLINALLPGAEERTSVLGGTTTQVQTFDWQPADGLPVRLVDLPGFAQNDAEHLAELARREAGRAHLVIYVCDGDLNRVQYQQLQALEELHKPLLIALNKADQYNPAELQQISQRLQQQLDQDTVWDLVPVQAGGMETVTVIDADGNERQVTRPRPPAVQALVDKVLEHLRSQRPQLEQRQAGSGLLLAARQLSQSEADYRREAAADLVEKYSRRAVIGALAAVAPGADIVIQGALATALVKALCELYDVPVREVDIDRFLEQATGKLKRNTSIVLAVAGNALKAFPGIGTLTGGLVHAVAYGMIFDTLGRALARSLATHAEWRPQLTLDSFEEQVLGNLERPARYVVGAALEQLGRRGGGLSRGQRASDD